MAVIVIIVAAVALFFPVSFTWISPKAISYLLGAVMLGMGMTLNLNDFKVVFTRPRDIIIGFLAQFILMPLIAWVLTKVFNLPIELAIGVILVGTCPGGTSSNVMTYLAGGDVALSVGMTGVSTIFAPLLTPVITWLLAGKMVDVSIVSMMMSIVQVVILPIAIGLAIRHYFPKFTDKITTYLPAFSTVAITLIVGCVVSANSKQLFEAGWLILIVVILHNVCGYALGYLVGWACKMNHQKRTAVSIEVGMQNSGLACSLATQHFQAMALATVPGAVFSVWHNISGAIYARIMKQDDVKQ